MRSPQNAAKSTIARYLGSMASAMAKASSMVINGRSALRSTAAPLMRQALVPISSSSTAVFKMAASRR